MTTTENSRADALTDERVREIGDSIFTSPVRDGEVLKFAQAILAAFHVEQPAPVTAQSALAAIDTFEIAGENNDCVILTRADRFILTEFIAHLFGGYLVEQHEAAVSNEQRSAINDASRVLEQNWEHATADSLREAFSIEGNAAPQPEQHADWRADFERQISAVGFDISREEFGGDYCHPDSAAAFRWYYTGRLDEACSGVRSLQPAAAPIPLKAQLRRVMDLLDTHLGDSDPMLEGMTQEEIEEEFPVVAAMQIVVGLYQKPPTESEPAPSPADERAVISEHDAKGLEIIAGWLDKDGLVEPAAMLRRIAGRWTAPTSDKGGAR